MYLFLYGVGDMFCNPGDDPPGVTDTIMVGRLGC